MQKKMNVDLLDSVDFFFNYLSKHFVKIYIENILECVNFLYIPYISIEKKKKNENCSILITPCDTKINFENFQ